MYNSTTEYILRLVALAAVVDGEASDQEKNFIIEEASYHLKTSKDEIKAMLDQWIHIYQQADVANNPGPALHFALDPISYLTGSDKHLAFYLCHQVIFMDGQMKESEDKLFFELEKIVFS